MSEQTARVTVTLPNEQGLHARPSALIVRTANQFRCQVTLRIGARTADCKSIMEVMMLASPRGTLMTFDAVGVEAESAVKALADLVSRGFGE